MPPALGKFLPDGGGLAHNASKVLSSVPKAGKGVITVGLELGGRYDGLRTYHLGRHNV